jgi:hypothetical protein
MLKLLERAKCRNPHCPLKAQGSRRERASRLLHTRLPSAGGGKDPDFWYAFEEGKVKVIGDEPANTDYHPGSSEKAVS